MERKKQKREVRRGCRYFVYCFDFDYVYVGGEVMKEARMGMKVRIVKHKELCLWQRKLLGCVGVVIDNDEMVPRVKFQNGLIGTIDVFKLEEVKEVKDFTKADLKDGMVLVYRNGWERYVIGDKLYDIKNSKIIIMSPISEFNNDLTDKYCNELDIMQVHDRGELIWKREEDIGVLFDEMEEGCLYQRLDITYMRIVNDFADILLFKSYINGDWLVSDHSERSSLKALRFVKVVE